MLVVPYAVGAANPSQIAIAAEARGHDVTFLVDQADAEAVAHRRLLEAFGSFIAIQDPREAYAALGPKRPAGVVTFSESTMLLAAAVAEAYDLPGYSSKNVSLLVDKAKQRERLNDEAVGFVATMEVRGGASVADVTKAPLPGVLKPKCGAGSRDTVFIDSLENLVVGLSRYPSDAAFVVEELLLGQPRAVHPDLASYLSVESAVSQGSIIHLGLTGRLPLAEPAREHGLIYPVSVQNPLQGELLDLAERAIAALGISHGMTHIEIMVTPHGPQIIEVNARLGGGLSSIIPAAGGPDVVGMAIELALGEKPSATPLPSGLAAHLYVQPPIKANSLKVAPDLKKIKSLNGVYGVDRRVFPNQLIDWRTGSAGRILDVWVRADDLNVLISSISAIEDEIASMTEWTFQDE